MKLNLRDLFWLTLVLALILTVFIRERQTIAITAEHREFVREINDGWRWSFDTLAAMHAQKTGVKASGSHTRVMILTPDGRVARKHPGDEDWEWKK